MSDEPSLIGIVLCERVLQDVLRVDSVSCVNIYNGITAQSFPAVVPLIYAFAQVAAGSKPDFEYQFKIKDDAGTEVAYSPPSRVKPVGSTRHHKIISAFTNLTFTKEGNYQISLEVEGKEIGALPLQVEIYKPPEQQPQQEEPAPVEQQ